MSNSVWPPEPPINESEPEKEARLRYEREAKKIRYVHSSLPPTLGVQTSKRSRDSDDIDRVLEQERQELRKRKPQTKILLLGMRYCRIPCFNSC